MHIHEHATTEQNDTTPEERHAAKQAEYAAALAEELDLDTGTVAAAIVEQHRAAHRAALQERLDAAVVARELTREQADAILAAQDADVLGGFGPRGHHGDPPVGFWRATATRD